LESDRGGTEPNSNQSKSKINRESSQIGREQKSTNIQALSRTMGAGMGWDGTGRDGHGLRWTEQNKMSSFKTHRLFDHRERTSHLNIRSFVIRGRSQQRGSGPNVHSNPYTKSCSEIGKMVAECQQRGFLHRHQHTHSTQHKHRGDRDEMPSTTPPHLQWPPSGSTASNPNGTGPTAIISV